MDKKLQLIRHLYGESDDRDALRDLLKDEALNHEYQELNESKFWLDHTTHDRPEQDVLDNIFAAAAQASTQSYNQPATPSNTRSSSRALRADRDPMVRQNKRRRLFAPITAVLTLVVTVGIGFQFFLSQNSGLNNIEIQELSQKSETIQNAPLMESEETFSEDGFAASADLEEKELQSVEQNKKLDAQSVLDTKPVFADRSRALDDLGALSGSGSISAVGIDSAVDTLLPEWNDDLDDVLRFQRRIEMLLEQNQDLAWDEAAVPLELLPTGRPANPGLLQAGSKTTKPGNQ